MVTLSQWSPWYSQQNRTYKPQGKNKHCKRKPVSIENQTLQLLSSTLYFSHYTELLSFPVTERKKAKRTIQPSPQVKEA
jgi:hypothetical protein